MRPRGFSCARVAGRCKHEISRGRDHGMTNLRLSAVRALWVTLIAGPCILHFGSNDFAPTWGAPEIPTWAIVGVFLTAGAGLVLGCLGVRRGFPRAHRGRYFSITILAVLALTPVTLFAL